MGLGIGGITCRGVLCGRPCLIFVGLLSGFWCWFERACSGFGGCERLCSPHPWGSPLRGPLKRSKLAPGQFVAWGMPCSNGSLPDFNVNKKAPRLREGLFHLIGSLAVNYSRMASATLPSSRLRFTSEFGMESGGSTALLPPGKNCFYVFNKQAESNSLSHHSQTPWALYG